jgi:hypothetical protein
MLKFMQKLALHGTHELNDQTLTTQLK